MRKGWGRRRRDPARRIATLAAESKQPLDDVLREVAEFRLALETDLLIAAAATDADAHDIAADILDAERERLDGFRRRMSSQLAQAVDARPRRRRHTRRTGRLATSAVAVAAVVGVAVFVAPLNDSGGSAAVSTVELADRQLDVLAGVASRNSSVDEVEDAADELHATIETLITEHADNNPKLVAALVELLREEQLLLAAQPNVGEHVLTRVQDLARQLMRMAPRGLRATLAPLVTPAARPRSTDPARPSQRPNADASSAPTETAQPSRSSSERTPSPRPSPSASSNGSSSGSPTPSAVPRPPVP